MDININEMNKGYVQIYTGNGKGKTTAAIGLAVRAAAAGLTVYVGQFVKEMEYGEVRMIWERFPEITVELFGNEAGCIVDRDVSEADIKGAEEGLAHLEQALACGSYDVVIADELTIPVKMGLLEEKRILDLIENKPDRVELIITGRGATEKMIEAADLVSEMDEVKHYYSKGVISRRGIEC